MTDFQKLKQDKKVLVKLELDPDMKTPIVYGHLQKMTMDIKKLMMRKKNLLVLVIED